MAAIALIGFTACEDVPAPYYVLQPQTSEELLANLEGSGVVDDPYTVADALLLIQAGAYSTDNVYVHGYISQIGVVNNSTGELTDLPGNSYGNCTYFISVDGTTTNQLEVYRGSGLGGEKITKADYFQVGDEIIVYGALTMYGSTPEITQGSKIYFLHGTTAEVEDKKSDVAPAGSGTKDDPYNVAATQELIQQVGNTNSDFIYTKGIISKIDEISEQYGNATYYISDDGSDLGQLEVYRGYGLGGNKFKAGDIKVGDEVIVYGQVINYYNNTPEFTQGSKLYSLNGETSEVETGGGTAGTATGDGTLENPYNSVAANEVAGKLASGATTGVVYIKGKVASITENYTTNFGNATFYISDDGTSAGQFYIYRALYLGNTKYTTGPLLAQGDDVIICGKLTKYGNFGTLETVQNEAYLYSLNGSTGSDTPPSFDTEGEGTKAVPYTVADVKTVYNAGGTTDKVYVEGYIVGSIDGRAYETGATIGLGNNPSNTNLVLAASPDETDINKCVPVQLPSGNVRTMLNIVDNPDNLGKHVVLYGTIEAYFSIAGVKNVTEAELGQ